jgi:hypothetical protein
VNIDPVVLNFRSTTEGAEKILHELEAHLAEAKARRDRILADISKANDAAVRDQRARLELPGLNKQEGETGRLIRSIEMQVSEARKRTAMAARAEAGRAKAAATIVDEGDERLFLVNTPHHLHQVRHKEHSVESLRSRLLPGYTIEGEIFGANDAGEGGVVAAIEPKGPSIMAGLLQAFGDELITYLAKHGIVSPIAQAPELADNKQTVVLPSNGREKLQ